MKRNQPYKKEIGIRQRRQTEKKREEERRGEGISSKLGRVLSTPKLSHITITDQASVRGVSDTPHLLGSATPEIVSDADHSLLRWHHSENSEFQLHQREKT